jgi:hypothetical protein
MQPVFEGSETSETGTHGGQIVLLSDSSEWDINVF